MIDAIVTQLKTGAIKNVSAYPANTLLSPPYIVVKEEPQAGRGRTQYRVIVHMAAGQGNFLRRSVRKDVYLLLANKRLTSAFFGCTNLVYSADQIDGAVVENDDKTISSERLFYVMDLF
jgi:hypothetical protein